MSKAYRVLYAHGHGVSDGAIDKMEQVGKKKGGLHIQKLWKKRLDNTTIICYPINTSTTL